MTPIQSCQAFRLLMLAAAFVLLWANTLFAETRFTIVSSTGAGWVSRGLNNYAVTPDDGWTFLANTNSSNGWVAVTLGGPGLPAEPSVDYWSLDFEAPNNGVLEVGSYEDATKWPFNKPSEAGMRFSSTGRADNALLADFVIRKFTVGPSNVVNTFAADFTYYGEGRLNEPVVGEIRFNSIPEPCSAAMLAIASGVGQGIRRRR